MTQTEERYVFKGFATRILKAQKKLGALKGLKATTLTLSETRKRNLKQAGLYSAAVIGTAALTAAGITLAHKRGKKNTDLTPGVYNGQGRKDVTPTAKRKFPKLSKKDKIKGAVGLAGAATPIVTSAAYLASKRQKLLIEAKYAYGTKLFEVSALSQEDLENGVDKKILREITAAVASLKKEKDWAVKESASIEFLNMATVAEALVEEVMYAEMLEATDVEIAAANAAREVSDFDDVEDVEEGFLFEDDCEDDDEDELAEAYIFEDEDLEEGYIFEDEDLEEGYIFEDEDLEEGYIFEDEDELVEAYIFEDEDEEDDEDLAEAYIFED